MQTGGIGKVMTPMLKVQLGRQIDAFTNDLRVWAETGQISEAKNKANAKLVKKGKPVMYQRDDGRWVCKGGGVEVVGETMRGAHTSWKNRKALLEMTPERRAALLSRRRPIAKAVGAAVFPFMM